MASGRRNGGISLVEVLLACVLLVVLAVPILDALRGLRLGYAHTADRTTASFVAQAVLEELRYRLYAFYRSDDPTKSLEQFLASLAEQDARVASWRDDERSRYFARFENLQGTGLHGFTPDRHPEIYARLYDMLCTVTVQTPFPAVDGGPPEEGLAEVEVRVSWARQRRRREPPLARPPDRRDLSAARVGGGRRRGRRRRRRTGRDGMRRAFTLVEVLVAAAVTIGLLWAAWGVFSVSGRQTRRIEGGLEASMALRNAADRTTRELREALRLFYPHPLRTDLRRRGLRRRDGTRRGDPLRHGGERGGALLADPSRAQRSDNGEDGLPPEERELLPGDPASRSSGQGALLRDPQSLRPRAGGRRRGTTVRNVVTRIFIRNLERHYPQG